MNGRVAVVTGAGSGIGRATSLALARAGATVAACDLDLAGAESTAAAIVSAGGRSTAHQVDVASEPEMRGVVAAVLAEHRHVDIVVNNAGIVMAPSPTADFEIDDFLRVMDVNFWGVVHGSLLFLPHLLTRPKANLVNVASYAALIGISRMGAYACSKFAVRGFTETLRMELHGGPVRVTLVCPGAAKTAIFRHSPVIDCERREALHGQFAKSFARPPERIAAAIVGAIRRGRPRVMAGPDAKIIDILARVAPGRYDHLLAPAIDRMILRGLGDMRSTGRPDGLHN